MLKVANDNILKSFWKAIQSALDEKVLPGHPIKFDFTLTSVLPSCRNFYVKVSGVSIYLQEIKLFQVLASDNYCSFQKFRKNLKWIWKCCKF